MVLEFLQSGRMFGVFLVGSFAHNGCFVELIIFYDDRIIITHPPSPNQVNVRLFYTYSMIDVVNISVHEDKYRISKELSG